jgi:hypothetical protein
LASEIHPATLPSPEFALLLACARASVAPSAAASARVRELAQSTALDWERLLVVGREHALRPLLYEELQAECPEALSPEFRTRFHDVMNDNAHYSLRLTQELLRVEAALRARGIKALPYKGPVLSAMAYRNLSMRVFLDLDILVAPGEVPQAKATLLEMGYHPTPELQPRQEAALLRSNCEFTFVNQELEIWIELHWRVAPSQFAIDFDVEQLWARSQSVILGAATVRTFSNEDLLLVLSVHAAKHLWLRLCWLIDVAAVVHSRPDIDWRRVLAEAERLSTLRILLITMHLCDKLLGLALPPEIMAAIDADSEVHAVADALSADMYAEREESSSLRTHRLLLRTRPRLRDKTRYALRVLFTPGVSEWALLSLPAPLAPLYPVIRMGRLVGKLFRGPARAPAPLAPSPRARS